MHDQFFILLGRHYFHNLYLLRTYVSQLRYITDIKIPMSHSIDTNIVEVTLSLSLCVMSFTVYLLTIIIFMGYDFHSSFFELQVRE